MLSAVLVLVTGSGYPDLVVGLAIGVYVIREAMEIWESAREARNEAQRD
jgi:Co/Zn/Cd efflux system component